MDELSGKAVVVIGATGAFGGLMARSLRARGAEVRLVVRRPDALASDLSDLPVAVADIRTRREVASALAEVALGRSLDGIVNCAGVVAFGRVGELSEEVASELMGGNSLGVLNVTSLASSHLSPGGFLVSFTGVAADMPVIGMDAYCASKAAAKMAMAVAARELRREKIRVIDVRAPHSQRATPSTCSTRWRGRSRAWVCHRIGCRIELLPSDTTRGEVNRALLKVDCWHSDHGAGHPLASPAVSTCNCSRRTTQRSPP